MICKTDLNIFKNKTFNGGERLFGHPVYYSIHEIDIDRLKNNFEFSVQLFLSGYPVLNKVVLRGSCTSIAEFNKLKQKMVH